MSGYGEHEYQVSVVIAVGLHPNFSEAAIAAKEMIAAEEYTLEYEVSNLTTGETKTVVV